MKFYKIAGLLIALLIPALSCKKTSSSQIPNVLVDFTIYTTDPLYYKLNAIGGWVYYPNAGVRGVIIYHQNVDEYKAYDRNCPYNSTSANAIVSVDSSNVMAVDTSCGSKFL